MVSNGMVDIHNRPINAITCCVADSLDSKHFEFCQVNEFIYILAKFWIFGNDILM